MKIVVGNKVDLEELTLVAYFDKDLAEVVVDSQLYAELATANAAKTVETSFNPVVDGQEASKPLLLSKQQIRAALFVKLVQILKLKKNAQKATVDFFLSVLNQDSAANSLKIPENGIEFYDCVTSLINAGGVRLSEKEHFVMEAQSHVILAVVALEVYKIKENTGCYDSILSLSCELLKAHTDNFTEFALTLGKSSQGTIQFRTNVQAIVDGSRLLTSGNDVDSAMKDYMSLPTCYQAHGGMHEGSRQLCLQLAQDLNADYSSLFNEKKYRELQNIASLSQETIVENVKLQVKPLFECVKTAVNLSNVRCQLLNKNWDEEARSGLSGLTTFSAFVAFLGAEKVGAIFKQELNEAFTIAKAQDDEIKAKKGAGKADAKKKPKKNAAPAPAPGLQLGRGSRNLFDFLAQSDLLASKDATKFNVVLNKDFKSELTEILQVRNQERRLPKCAKGTRDMTPLAMAIRQKAFEKIKNVFFKHGACEIDTPVFELKETLTGKYGEDSKLIYDLQDQGGELLALRYDLTVPFARFVATERIQQIKRFHMAKVYRRDQPQMNKGRFREFYQCDFDIAGDYAPMIPDAEVLSVVQEILTDLEIGQFTVKVNNRKFLDAMVELAGCERRKFKTICSSIDKLDKEPWEKVKKELINQKGLTEEMTDKLYRFVQFKGKPWDLLNELKSAKVFEGHEVAEKTLEEMELLFTYLEGMGSLDNVLFDFSLARGLDYYTGLIYEVVLTGSDRGSIAGGGRYDGLVGMFSGKNIPAVGVSVGIERIFAILEKKAEEEKKIRATKTQILIAQVGKNLTTERMKILGELWKADICAETMYLDNPKPAKQLDFAFDNGIPLIMWIGEDEISRGVVKVKSLSFHEEYFINRTEMVAKVKELIALNPCLMGQEEQEELKKSGGLEERKGPGLTVIKAAAAKPITERLDDLEERLGKTQWLGGQQLSSLDKDAIDDLQAAGGVTLLSPLKTPNLYAWYSIVSKFSPEIQQSWPKMKAPAPAKSEAQPEAKEVAPKEEQKKGRGDDGKKNERRGKPEAAKKPDAGGLSDELDTFAACDVRVGKIVECAPHPESEKLYIEKIDLGEGGKLRTIVSGLQPFISLDEMLADKIIVFANMKPKRLAGIMSEGMVLCASNADHTTVELMRPHQDSVIGERVTLEGNLFGPGGLTQEVQPILNPKKKTESKFLDKLLTTADRTGHYDGKKLVTSAGAIVAKSLANARIS